MLSSIMFSPQNCHKRSEHNLTASVEFFLTSNVNVEWKSLISSALPVIKLNSLMRTPLVMTRDSLTVDTQGSHSASFRSSERSSS